MPDSVYNVIELVGTSSESWEKAAEAAVNLASGTFFLTRPSIDGDASTPVTGIPR